MKDDAGLLFQINTIGLTDVMLAFDWRTFRTECFFGCDELVVGYCVGEIAEFSGSDYADLRTGPAAWGNWSELLRGENENSWTSEVFALPAGEASVYVGIWLDDGNHDYGKFDNLTVTAVPEPGTMALTALGLGILAWRQSKARTV